jgi:hypothetical protein
MKPGGMQEKKVESRRNSAKAVRQEYSFSLFFFFLQYWGLNSEPTPWATPPELFL